MVGVVMQRSDNFFDKLVSYIPGYKGYLERYNRRKSDKILREKIGKRLSACENTISNKIVESGKKENYSQIDVLSECRKKISILNDKILCASYGESSFFSKEQLKEDELFNIFQKDLALFNQVDNLTKTIDELDVRLIMQKIDEFEVTIADRNEYIMEFK